MVETRVLGPENIAVMEPEAILDFAQRENIPLTQEAATEVVEHWKDYLESKPLNTSELRQLIQTFAGTSPLGPVPSEEAA